MASEKEGTTFISIPGLENVGHNGIRSQNSIAGARLRDCLLYTSDAADDANVV